MRLPSFPASAQFLRAATVCLALAAAVAGCGSPRSAPVAQPTPSSPAIESPTPTPSPTPSASPSAAQQSPRPAAQPPRTSAPPQPARDQSGVTVRGRSELVTALNVKRQAMRLKPVAYNANLSALGEDCARKSLAAGKMTHCGYEVLAMGGPNMTVDQLIAMWFNSPPHKAALTHPTSTIAGGAIVSNGRNVVAAIRIDY
ncbi:hypothetical protein Lfu02_21830 [Longispora fulva]|nr:hypothetical protein Lfu02_21830 [Longispora fulva]